MTSSLKPGPVPGPEITERPGVSVLMPVRNGGEHLRPAVLSVLEDEAGPAVELLLVDDGSTDDAVAAVAREFAADRRLRILAAQGRGLVAALNTGLAAARAPLVARLDADDLNQPGRLARQAHILRDQPGIGLVACRVEAFPAQGVGKGMQHYLAWQDGCLSHDQIANGIYRESPFVHSAVMFRRALVERHGPYREGPFPEDYELWLRWHRLGVRMLKVEERLVRWRQSPNSLSHTDERYARGAFDRLRANYLARDPRLDGGRPVVVWGAGRSTRKRVKVLLDCGIRLSAWIDIDPRKIGNVVWGLRVRDGSWLADQSGSNRPFVLVYVANHGAAELVGSSLEQMRYEAGADYLVVG